ncbi:MAG: hypothetical protein AB7E85_00575 [Pseudobdellovibrionaceae bacterium]
MRGLIFVIVAILAGGILYVVMNVGSYESPRNTPLTLDQPLEMPTEIEENSAANKLTDPAMKAQLQQAVAVVSDTIKSYEDEWAAMPEEAEIFRSILLPAIKQGRLPAFYPLVDPTKTKPVSFTKWKFDPAQFVDMELGSECTDLSSLVVGDTENNEMQCPPAEPSLARGFFMGPGDDKIGTGGTPSIVDASSGEDAILGGPMPTIIYVGDNQSSVLIDLDCSRADVESLPRDPKFPVPWTYKYSHFIVFGPQVNENDIVLDAQNILNKRTNATIRLRENCVNMVFTKADF